VSRPKISENATDTTAVGNFIPFISNKNVAAQVIKEFSLDQPPRNVLPDSLFGSIVTIEEVRNSTIVLVKGRMDDPALLARVLNRIAEIGAEAARLASRKEALQAQDDIKQQLDDSLKRLTEAENRLKAEREKDQLELLKKDVESALQERAGLLKLQIEIEREKAALAKAESELAARQPLGVVSRTIDSDPALVEAARQAGAAPRDLLGLKLRSEEINEVYQKLDEEVAKSRAKVAGLERQRAQMAARQLDGPQLAALKTLYAAEAEIARLEMARDLSRKIYQEVATSYETARLFVASRSSALQIVGPAVPPDRPASRYLGRNAVLAFVAGVVLASLVIVLRHALVSAAAPPRAM
jgi:uncharacterized protein involved in exopolysaccharide biosynthesis